MTSPRLNRWLTLIGTAAYAAGLLWGLHCPRLPTPLSESVCLPSDKSSHFVYFMGLAILISLTAVLWKQATPKTFAIIVVGIVTAAALSEATQPLTNRNAEFMDWAASAAGAGTGTILSVGLRRKAKQRGRKATGSII